MNNPNIEPQTCKVGKDEINNKEGIYVAQEKFDGHRAVCVIDEDGYPHFYSRRTSKVTGEKEDNTSRLPYMITQLPMVDTILDGELVVAGHTDSSKVQHILGATPAHAKEMWEGGCHLVYKVFDVLRYEGRDLSNVPLITRLLILGCYVYPRIEDTFEIVPTFFDKKIKEFFKTNINKDFPRSNLIFREVADYKSLYNSIVERGGEGIILKKLESPYLYKRTDDWLKYKECHTFDLICWGYIEPKKDYTGKFSVEELRERGWEYWENDKPVNRSYALGYKAGLECYLIDDSMLGKVKVADVKGFGDEVQEKLKTIKPPFVVEVAYQEIIKSKNKVRLRHPRFVRFREDKDVASCTIDNMDR